MGEEQNQITPEQKVSVVSTPQSTSKMMGNGLSFDTLYKNIMGGDGKPHTVMTGTDKRQANGVDASNGATTTATSNGNVTTNAPVKKNAWAKDINNADAQNAQHLRELDDARLQQAMEYQDYKRKTEEKNAWNKEQGLGETPVMPKDDYNTIHPIKTKTPQYSVGNTPSMTPKTDTRSAYQKFRDSMYDEDKIRKESERRTKILAVGDALRHLGNLYYTTNHAVPQQLSTTPDAVTERDNYEKGREARDAKAYSLYTAKQKEDIAAADKARKDALNQADIEYKGSQTKLNMYKIQGQALDNYMKEQRWPYELQTLMGEALEAKGKGDQAIYDAKIKEAKAKYADKAEELEIALTKAKIDETKASAAALRAQVEKTRQEIRQGKGDLSYPVYNSQGKYDPTSHYVISGESRKNLVHTMAEYVTDKGWAHGKATEGIDARGRATTTYEQPTEQEVLMALLEHADDKYVQRAFSKFGGRPVAAPGDSRYDLP